jgi:hypothetical protein
MMTERAFVQAQEEGCLYQRGALAFVEIHPLAHSFAMEITLELRYYNAWPTALAVLALSVVEHEALKARVQRHWLATVEHGLRLRLPCLLIGFDLSSRWRKRMRLTTGCRRLSGFLPNKAGAFLRIS